MIRLRRLLPNTLLRAKLLQKVVALALRLHLLEVKLLQRELRRQKAKPRLVRVGRVLRHSRMARNRR